MTRYLFCCAALLGVFVIDNPHPEISWSALWGKVWYESYPEPDYVWQSTSANSDFEPKLSLAPLAFGTLKAAFYAMLLAAPLAQAGAAAPVPTVLPELAPPIRHVIVYAFRGPAAGCDDAAQEFDRLDLWNARAVESDRFRSWS